MFNLFKNLKELKQLNDLVSSESVVVEKDGIRIKINGKMELEEIILNPSLDVLKQQKILKELFNEAVRKVQIILMNKLGGRL
ncbi:MAG: hypothetical protein NC816_01440 [Candidatus Omnitrophica bacterium]|nr:hypothetical protein [Candidatus Omnitrophota bacterium]